MKITDVTLTLFAWESIPSTVYGRHTARPTGQSDLGLLRLMTDEGIEGHAYYHWQNTMLGLVEAFILEAPCGQRSRECLLDRCLTLGVGRRLGESYFFLSFVTVEPGWQPFGEIGVVHMVLQPWTNCNAFRPIVHAQTASLCGSILGRPCRDNRPAS